MDEIIINNMNLLYELNVRINIEWLKYLTYTFQIKKHDPLQILPKLEIIKTNLYNQELISISNSIDLLVKINLIGNLKQYDLETLVDYIIDEKYLNHLVTAFIIKSKFKKVSDELLTLDVDNYTKSIINRMVNEKIYVSNNQEVFSDFLAIYSDESKDVGNYIFNELSSMHIILSIIKCNNSDIQYKALKQTSKAISAIMEDRPIDYLVTLSIVDNFISCIKEYEIENKYKKILK